MIDDPAEALDILLEELKRQKAAGVRRVSITADSLATLKSLAGAPVAPPAAAASAPSVRPPAVTGSAPARPALAPVVPAAPAEASLVREHPPVVELSPLVPVLAAVAVAPAVGQLVRSVRAAASPSSASRVGQSVKNSR